MNIQQLAILKNNQDGTTNVLTLNRPGSPITTSDIVNRTTGISEVFETRPAKGNYQEGKRAYWGRVKLSTN